MNKQELNAAFSCVKASDDLIRETLAIEKGKKIAPRKILRRVVACAAVLALFFGVLVFKIPFPLLNIPVYARALNDKELNVSFFVPKYEAPSHEVKPEDKYLISSFNSDQNASLYSGPTFSMSLHLNEKTTEYEAGTTSRSTRGFHRCCIQMGAWRCDTGVEFDCRNG